MVKRKRNMNKYFPIFLIIILIGVLFSFGVFNETFGAFTNGYEPYGESSNTISGIGKIDNFEDWQQVTDILPDIIYKASSENSYWKFSVQSSYRFGTTPSITGNDFNIIHTSYNSDNIIETVQDLSDKDFKVTLESRAYDDVSGDCRGATHRIVLNINSKDHLIKTEFFPCSFERNNLEILSSAISKKIGVYYNGELIETLDNTGGKVSVKFLTQGRQTLKIINPSWRELYGCSKNADEQFYLRVFNEGEKVSFEALSEFKKVCLNEGGLSIYTNVGSTKDNNVIVDILEGKTYTVPKGQIWTIEYIGELQNPESSCESGEVYNLEEETCMAKTAITFDFGDNQITEETQQTVFTPIDIQTYITLQENQEFKLIDRQRDLSDFGKTEDEKIIFLGKTFISQNPIGFNTGSFTFDNKQYTIGENTRINLNEYISVELKDLSVNYELGELDDYSAEYVFRTRDLSFTEINYDNGIIINNKINSFKGGYTLTATDIFDTTKIENIDYNYQNGENKINIDTANLREIKLKPYFIAESDDFNFNIDLDSSIKLDTSRDEVIVLTENKYIETISENLSVSETIAKVIFYGVITLFLIIIGVIIQRNLKNKRKQK